jgi:hypothetical protein
LLAPANHRLAGRANQPGAEVTSSCLETSLRPCNEKVNIEKHVELRAAHFIALLTPIGSNQGIAIETKKVGSRKHFVKWDEDEYVPSGNGCGQ